MSDSKKSNIVGQIIVAVVIALLVGGTAPWWWKEFFSDKTEMLRQSKHEPGPIPSPITGTIGVRCSANPQASPAGDQVEIKVLAFTEQNLPVAGATVRVEAGGGWFLTHGTATEIGTTDAKGVFTTQWRSPLPAAAAYAMSITVSKEGFNEGKAECLVPIK